MFAQRLDIGARRRPAFAALLRHLIKAEAFIVGAVEIGGARQLQRRRALDEAPARHIGPPLVQHIERAARPVKLVGAPLLAFASLQEGTHGSIAPSPRHGSPLLGRYQSQRDTTNKTTVMQAK